MIFFFFQAEDGIRDYKVTGVQTCALPISSPPLWCEWPGSKKSVSRARPNGSSWRFQPTPGRNATSAGDRKSTRLNSSHLVISYAVFCLKKKICCKVPHSTGSTKTKDT